MPIGNIRVECEFGGATFVEEDYPRSILESIKALEKDLIHDTYIVQGG